MTERLIPGMQGTQGYEALPQTKFLPDANRHPSINKRILTGLLHRLKENPALREIRQKSALTVGVFFRSQLLDATF